MNRKELIVLKEKVDSAGERRSQLKVTTCTEVYPRLSRVLRGRDSEEWVHLHCKLAVTSSPQLILGDYNVRACIEVSIFDRNAGCFLCEKVNSGSYTVRNGFVEFFIPLIPQCAVGSRRELQIQIVGKVTCKIPVTVSVYNVPKEESGEQSAGPYMIINLNNGT